MIKKMNLPDIRNFRALVFDLDGTLIDSMPVHNLAWHEALALYGLKIHESILEEFAGISTEKTVEILNQRFGWQLNPVTFSEEKENFYKAKMNLVKPIEPILEIARTNYLKKPMAIVTGGSRDLVNQVLALHRFDFLFSAVICAEDTIRSKRYPDPFLLAAEKLNVDPRECIFFDDGDLGLLGAKEAGMSVIKVE